MQIKTLKTLDELFKIPKESGKSNDLKDFAWQQCHKHNPKDRHSLWQKMGLAKRLSQSLMGSKNLDKKPVKVDESQKNTLHLFWVDGIYDQTLSQNSGQIEVETVSRLDEELEHDWLSFLQDLPKYEIPSAMSIVLSDKWDVVRIKSDVTVNMHHILTGKMPLVAMNQQIQVEKNAIANIQTSFHVKGKEDLALICNIGLDIDENSKVFSSCLESLPNCVSILRTQRSRLKNKAQYHNHQLATGGSLFRNYHQVDLNGMHAESEFHGVFLGADQDKLDQVILLKHNSSKTKSIQSYKNIARSKSLTGFSSRVFVKEGISNIQSQQVNHNLLMEKGAHMISEPELEIYSDEVECAHGSTIGQMDEKSIFYMKSRGLSEKSAKELLVKGFIVDKINDFAMGFQKKAHGIVNAYLEGID